MCIVSELRLYKTENDKLNLMTRKLSEIELWQVFRQYTKLPGIWDRLQVAMRRRAEACIQAGGRHMEHLL
jgi:hypothetical protein